MQDKTWKFAVIGLGSIAHFHIRSIQELDNCELVAVSSTDAERAASAGKRYQIDAYTDYLEILTRPDIDIVCICTISGQHLEPCLAAAAHGKHVITEKPLEVSLDRADQMISACKANQVSLACIFQNRFRKSYQEMRQAIKSGKIGKPVLGNAYIKWHRDENYYASRNWRGTKWGDGGAALINQSIHTIDLLLDLMGPVKSVVGKIRTLKHEIEGEDLGLGILSFESGAMGTIEGSTAIYPGYPEKLEVHGSKGSIVYEGGSISAWHVPGETKTIAPPADSGAADPMAIDFIYHQHQIQDFVESLAEGRLPLVDGTAGRQSLEIIQAIYASSESGKEIFLS